MHVTFLYRRNAFLISHKTNLVPEAALQVGDAQNQKLISGDLLTYCGDLYRRMSQYCLRLV